MLAAAAPFHTFVLVDLPVWVWHHRCTDFNGLFTTVIHCRVWLFWILVDSVYLCCNQNCITQTKNSLISLCRGLPSVEWPKILSVRYADESAQFVSISLIPKCATAAVFHSLFICVHFLKTRDQCDLLMAHDAHSTTRLSISNSLVYGPTWKLLYSQLSFLLQFLW